MKTKVKKFMFIAKIAQKIACLTACFAFSASAATGTVTVSYELNGETVSFSGATLRAVNDQMRTFWEVSGDGCAYNAEKLPADGTGTLTWTVSGTVEQGDYLDEGALVLPSLSGGYIYRDGTYRWKKIEVKADGPGATIISNPTFGVHHSYLSTGTDTTTVTGVTLQGGLYVVPHGTVTFDGCTFTGQLRVPNGDGAFAVTDCTFTGTTEAQDPDGYVMHYQAAGTLAFTGNTVADGYKRGLNIDNKDLTATVEKNKLGTTADAGRSAIQISKCVKLAVTGNEIKLNGGNAFTFHQALLGLSAAPEVSISGNTVTGTGYLVYDDAVANGKAFTSDNLKLTYGTDNTVAATVDTTKGVKGTTEYELSGTVATTLHSVDFAAFVQALTDANGVYDGNGITVTLKDSERSYQNNKTAQFFVGATDVNITDPIETVKVSNVNFVFEDDVTDNDYTSGELQVFAKYIEFTGCTFNGVAVSPWGKSNAENAETATFTNCTWTDLFGRYGIHQNRASNLTVTNCRFENCERGIHTNSGTVKSIVITDNTFTGIGAGYGVLCLAEKNGDLSKATLNIAGNVAENQVMLRQLSSTVTYEQVSAILDTTKNTYGTAYVSESIEPMPPVDPRTLGYAASGTAAALPAAPDMSGAVVDVTAAQAQYVLDGAYGSIDGKTINFTESVADTLVIGRASKYDGSKTLYRHGSHGGEALSYADFIAYKNQSGWTESCYYERTVENVTFTANTGVIVNFTAEGGAHIYAGTAPVYDYVRDTGTWVEVGSCYFKRAILKNITFKGLTFTAKTNIETSESTTVYDGFTFKDCTFDLGTTAAGNQAIRYYSENNNGNVKNLVVDHCAFRNCNQGVYTMHVNGITVKNSTFTQTGHNAIAIQSQGGVKGPCNHGEVVITDNVMVNIGDRAIRFNEVAAGTAITITGNTAAYGDGTTATDEQCIKATTLAEGVTTTVELNNWNNYAVAANKPLTETVAKIGTTDYKSLEDATEAAQGSDVITIVGYTSNMKAPDGWKFETADGVTTLVADPVLVKDADGKFHIASYDDLLLFKKMVNEKGMNFSGETVVLDADIDMASVENWEPIGNASEKKFAGTFDGQNHTISGLKITGGSYVGLFGYLGAATVRNVALVGANVSGVKRVGALVGQIAGNATIKNCSLDATSSVTGSDSNTGGLIGEASGSIVVTLENLTNNAPVTNTESGTSRAGGILGQATSGASVTLKNCVNNGTITTNGGYAGGIVSAKQGGASLVFDGCSNTGTLTDGTKGTGALLAWSCNGSSVTISNYSGDVANAIGWLSQDNYDHVFVINGVEHYIRVAKAGSGYTFASRYEAVQPMDKSYLQEIIGFFDYAKSVNNNFATYPATPVEVLKSAYSTVDGSIRGSLFNTDPSSGWPQLLNQYNQKSGKSLTSDNFAVTWGTPDVLFMVGDAVAQIGENKYYSLQAAIAAASDNEVIDLLANTTLPDSYVLDKGVTIRSAGETRYEIKGLKAIAGSGATLENVFLNLGQTLDIGGTDTTLKNCVMRAKDFSYNDVYTEKTTGFTVGDYTYLVRVTGTRVSLTDCRIDGTDKNGEYFPNMCLAPVSGTDVTMTRCTFNEGFAACWYSTPRGTWTLEDCTFTKIYSYNIHAGDTTAKIVVKGCSLAGWTSFGASMAEVSFENCTFAKSSGYAQINAYKNATFSGCTFTEDYKDNLCVMADAAVDLNGCSVVDGDGQPSETVSLAEIVELEAATAFAALDATKDEDGKYTAGTFVGSKDTIRAAIAEGCVLKTEANGSHSLVRVPDSYVVDEDGNVTIADEAALIWFARQVNEEGNTFEGKTVKLQADVTLTETWTPVGVEKSFNGVFDGDGHTISGMRVFGEGYGLGFFKTVISATVKNVTFANAEVSGESCNIVGLVVGYSYGSSVFEDVHVTGSTVHAFGKVGGIVGMAADPGKTTTFRNCSVRATTIHGGYNVAGFCGLVQGPCALSGSSLTAVTPIVDEDAQGFGKVVELDTTVVCDGSVATCAGSGTVIKGKYIPNDGYYYSAWSDLYNHYGASSHDCTLADGKLLANSEVVHDAPVEIGDVKYSDLQAAFDAAKKGDTVTLLSDITLTEQVNITKALDGLTLDGNGKTITCATTDDPFKSGGSALYFGNANDQLYCTGIKIKDLTMTGTARFAIFLCGGTSTTFTNVKISGHYYFAINLYGTHGATMTGCDISNSTTGTDENISAIWSNVASANPLTLNNTKVDVIAINKYKADNELAPKIYVNAGSTVDEIHTFDDGEFSGDMRLCVGASPVMPPVKIYDETDKIWIDAPDKVSVKPQSGDKKVTLPDALLENVTGETRAEKVSNLNKQDANGNLAWVNLVAGIESTKNVTMAAPQNDKADVIKVDLPAVGPAPAGTDVTVRYEIRAEGSDAPVVSSPAAEGLMINLDGQAGIGTYRTYVCLLQNGTEVARVASENAMGVLKTVSAAKKTIIAVPWLSLTDGNAIAVADLVKTAGLTAGDKLHVYNKAESRYDVYELAADKTWAPKAIYKVGADGTVEKVSSGTPETTKVARGNGVWLERQDTTKAIVSYGQVASGTGSTAIDAGTAEKPTWNLLAVPTTTAVNVAATFGTSEADTLIVPTAGAPKICTVKDGAWAYEKTVSVTDKFGNQTGVKVIRENVTELSAGTGFWYLNGGTEKTVNW